MGFFLGYFMTPPHRHSGEIQVDTCICVSRCALYVNYTVCVYIQTKTQCYFRECVVVLYFLNLLRNYKLEIETCNVYLLIYRSHIPSI